MDWCSESIGSFQCEHQECLQSLKISFVSDFYYFSNLCLTSWIRILFLKRFLTSSTVTLSKVDDWMNFWTSWCLYSKIKVCPWSPDGARLVSEPPCLGQFIYLCPKSYLKFVLNSIGYKTDFEKLIELLAAAESVLAADLLRRGLMLAAHWTEVYFGLEIRLFEVNQLSRPQPCGLDGPGNRDGEQLVFGAKCSPKKCIWLCCWGYEMFVGEFSIGEFWLVESRGWKVLFGDCI